ncbi:alpha/beta hydrolase [Sphingomonas sp. KR1UV-12]|uniref:Alpha/beta hydrolase n=1 Tax=Sphingomonas aurea TaxID=3063994 RepID=A0ABT9ELL7_9SPHN|nr:alpha/beta hydrolase [Sphingomonas sp. KR1UV-12]MDP1027831.1 alpha/beta hydrolase [Sphingomonas sp. KR1UV-12]
MFHTGEATGPTILMVPGLGGSGPSHWQSLWAQRRADTSVVDFGDWNTPHRNSWVATLDRAIANAQAPVILVAHSLGCLAVAWWAHLSPQPYGWPVAGALLVAPADVDRPAVQEELRGFSPSPAVLLPFPSTVVASRNDPWISAQRAHSYAAGWGSHFVDIGEVGHINAASGLGYWPEGEELLDRVIAAALDGHARPRAPGDARAMLSHDRSGAGQRLS